MSLRSKLDPLLRGCLTIEAAHQQLENFVSDAMSARDGKGLFFLALARLAYLHAFSILNELDGDILKKNKQTLELFLSQALNISEKGAHAGSLRCLVFYCHLASSLNHSGWQKRMQKLLKNTGWVDPAQESLYEADLGALALPCDLVPGDTAEERSNAQLETAKNVIMQDKELSKGGQMTLMLLCSLIGEGRPICPKNFDPRLPLQRLCHLKDMRAAVAPVRGGKPRQDRQEPQRAVPAKVAGKKSERNLPKQILAAVEEELEQQGQSAACSLLTITVEDLANKVEELHSEEHSLESEALAYWLHTEGLAHGYAGLPDDATFLDPEDFADKLEANLMLPRTESLKAQLGYLFGGQVPTDDAMAEYSRQALRGEGFLHQGQLPTDLPKLPVYTGLATSSCQSGKATDMLPLTGRDPRLLEAVGEFQDAIHLAHQSGVLNEYAANVDLHRKKRTLHDHFQISFETLKLEIATAEFGSSPYTKCAALEGFDFAENVLGGLRVRLKSRAGKISEEPLLQLSARGLHLLQLVQCYGRLCLLQSTSGQLHSGDKVLVQTMTDSIAVLSGKEGQDGSILEILKIIVGAEPAHDDAVRHNWLRWHRFPCHLLGPDGDAPVADSLGRSLDDSLGSEVMEDRNHRQLLLDIIIDVLWLLQRNKLLTSGLVYEIALQMMVRSKDHRRCSVHSLSWEDLGRLKSEALQNIAHNVCSQLGLCQDLVREYADARQMIAQAESLVLGQEGNVAVEHLKSVQVGPEHSAAYTASQLRSLCNASLDTNAGLHRGKKENESRRVIDYVDALFKESTTPTPCPPKLKHMTASDIEALMELSIGCLDQAILWQNIADAVTEHHKEYLHACADFLRKASEMVDGGVRASYEEVMWKAFSACRDASTGLHKSLKATVQKEALLLNLRKDAVKTAPMRSLALLNDNIRALCKNRQSDMEVTEAVLQEDMLKSRCKEEMEQIQPLTHELEHLLYECFMQLASGRNPEKNKELASKYMQNLAHNILQDLFLLEFRGVHLVEIKMEAARLGALMDLRAIIVHSENCIPDYLEEAAISCLKDKLTALAAKHNERKLAAEEEEHRRREERSTQQANELLRELDEEKKRDAEAKKVQEEKKRRKSKANAKNAKLEEERAARDKAEQEAAAQRAAEEEQEREEQRKAAKELQAKEEQFRQMQEQLQKDAAASQPAVSVPSPKKIPHVEEIPVPVKPRPKAASSRDRQGGREHGSETSSTGRGTQEKGASEANGHASTADSNGGNASQGVLVVRKQGSHMRTDAGAARDGASAESRRVGKEASQSGSHDGSDGNRGSASQQEPLADHNRSTRYAVRDASQCLHCTDPDHGVATCPKLEGLDTQHRSALVSGYLAGHRMKVRRLLQRLQPEKPNSSRSGSKRSGGKSGGGKSAALSQCLHCKLEDHRTMTCPALAKLSMDARANVNQAYLDGRVEFALTLLQKHLGEDWSQSLRDGVRHSKVDASTATERPEDTRCELCVASGHRVKGCPIAQKLPQKVLQRVVDLASSGKRHFALNLIIAHWKHNGGTPYGVPHVKTVRQHNFCCHCNADTHKTTNCPELKDMDIPSRDHLDYAYSQGSWQGKSPEQLYDEWLQEHSDEQAVTCTLCGQQHSVEDCPQLKSLPFSTFNQIVETCTAGDVAMARAMLESLKLDSGPKEAAGSKPSQRAYFEAAAPAKEQQSLQTAHPPERATSTSQAAKAEVQPLKPGFWKSMKLPAKDPPLGGIRVRTDMANDCSRQCMHCLSKAHNFKECPELSVLTDSCSRSLQYAYMDGDLQRARRVIEIALGCRMCRRDKHWIANCPRVPKHIRSEIEEIYSKGPVEAAVKLANNALQTRAPMPGASHAPASTAGPVERSQATATSSGPPARPLVNWAAAVKKGIDQEEQQGPSLSQAEAPPAVSQLAPCPDAAAAGSTADESTVERPQEEDAGTVSAESLQDVKASERVWHFLADARSQSDVEDGSEAGASSSGPQPLPSTVPGGPFLSQQHSPARRVTFAPLPMSTGGLYSLQQSPPPKPLQSAPAALSSPAPPVLPVPPHMQPSVARLPSVTGTGRSAGAVPSAENGIGYRPWVPRSAPAALPSHGTATLPGLNDLFPSPARPPPPGFPPVRQEEARVQSHLDLEAAMRVFGAPESTLAASTGASEPPLLHLPRPAASQLPAAAPSQSAWPQPGALHGLGAHQLPAGRHASAPAASTGAQLQLQEPNSDEYLFKLLGIGGPKPASQQQQQQQQQASSAFQPASVSQQDGGQSESEDASECSDYTPAGALPQAYWQRPGSQPVSPARKPLQQGAWRKPLGAAVFVDSPARSAPASAVPSPNRTVPHAWPGVGWCSLSCALQSAEAGRNTAPLPHQTAEEQSESEEDDDEEEDNDEEEELNAAIEASLQEQHVKQGLGVMQEAAMTKDGPQHHMALAAHIVATPGLQNLTGEYNCFLNVIVQCLWHCMAFRSGMLHRLDPEQLQGVPVVRELLGLFQAFEREEAQRSTPEAVRPATIAPNALREALHDLNPCLFSVGEMSDAAEVLNAVYDSLGEVPGGPELVDAVFGLRVRESVHCGDCGRDTHEASYTQSFYNVSATALRMQALVIDPNDDAPSLGQALWEVEQQTLKSCDTDRGGCGRDQQVRFFLEGTPPAAFTLQLAWERHQESAADIRDTMATIQETLDLGEVYLGQPADHYIYRMRSMVCYYGAHYHAFVHRAGRWIMFDDANTSVVGGWDAVLHKCQLGKIQPSVLFFERSVSAF